MTTFLASYNVVLHMVYLKYNVIHKFWDRELLFKYRARQKPPTFATLIAKTVGERLLL